MNDDGGLTSLLPCDSRHEVTGLSVHSMKSIETKAITIFDWILCPKPEEWLEFLQQFRRREALAQLTAIGSERQEARYGSSISSMTSPSLVPVGSGAAQKRPIQVIDELIADVRLTMAVPEPVFPGDSATALPETVVVVERSPVSPASSLAESFSSHGSSAHGSNGHSRSRAPPPATMKTVVEELYPSLTRPMSWSLSDFPSSGASRDIAGADRTMRPSLSAHEDVYRRPQHSQEQQSSYRPHQYHPYQQYYQAAAPVRRIKTPAAWDPSTSARLLDSPVAIPMGRMGRAVQSHSVSDVGRSRPVYEAVQRPHSLHAAPVPVAPAPRMDEYSRMQGGEVMEIPRAAYGVGAGEFDANSAGSNSGRSAASAATAPVAASAAYEGANDNTRSWYETLPKSFISPPSEISTVGFGRSGRGASGHGHAGSWAASFSSMISSF